MITKTPEKEAIETKATETKATETKATFEQFGFDEKINKSLSINKFIHPTEIQNKAIPLVLDGHDVMASAQTGAGKTMAFVLPALQCLMSESKITDGRGPRVLILTPTRELAMQINDAIAKLSRFTQLVYGTLMGGVPYPAQERMLRRPLDLLVATPGRLIDHIEEGRIDFSRIEFFVLDEADRMLDMGFIDDMQYVMRKLPKSRQTLLFSATLEGKIERIARDFLKKPVLIQLTSPKQQHASIAQHSYQADNFEHKRALLAHILDGGDVVQAIVFTATKRGADRLADELSLKGMPCAALHGDMKQSKRMRTLEQMHKKRIRVLVATDVAARGIDVKDITHVINFDLPSKAEDYVHRIGRTGRCGANGIAISLIGPQDWPKLLDIERFTGQKIAREVIEGLEPRANSFRQSPANSKPRHRSEGGFKNKFEGKPRFKPQFAKSDGSKPFAKKPRFAKQLEH